ncbi:hypothetical protein Tco_0570947 [Tanacetum coccineum]
MAPRSVLMKTGLSPLNTARPVNTAHPKTTVYSSRPMSHFSKSTQSTVKRPYQIKTALTNKNFCQKVNTAKGSFYTTRPKAVNTARLNSAVVNAVRANQVNTVKASACWVWRPTKLNSASINLKKHNYVDARGRSKNLMEDMLPLGEEPKEGKLPTAETELRKQDKGIALETDLKQTKTVYGAALTKLIKKVKRLEKKDKLSKLRRKLRLVLSDEEALDSDILAQEVPPNMRRENAQIAQERKTWSTKYLLDYKRSDEEDRQRIARVHEAARSFSEVEWEDIRARVEASEELIQRLQTEEREKAAEEELGQQSSKNQKLDELSQEELQQLMIIVPEEGMNIEALQTKYPIID